MLSYIAKRVAGQLLVLLATSLVVFAFLHLAPGGPARLLLAGHPITKAAIDAVNVRYGLNRPLPAQYLSWLFHAVHGNFGQSIKERASVAHVVLPRFETTLELTMYALVIIMAIGIPVGIVSARFRGRAADVGATTLTLAVGAIPSYVTGIVFIVIFAVELQILPAFGGGGGGVGNTLSHLTLPAFALAFAAVAFVSRTTRSAMIQSLESDYVEAARIRGLSERRVVLKHGLRSALIPVMTISGAVVGYLLSGAILVEYVFGIDGMGALLVRSVQALDYPVVQAIALIFTAEFLLINLVVDLLYGVVDPRARLRGVAGAST